MCMKFVLKRKITDVRTLGVRQDNCWEGGGYKCLIRGWGQVWWRVGVGEGEGRSVQVKRVVLRRRCVKVSFKMICEASRIVRAFKGLCALVENKFGET